MMILRYPMLSGTVLGGGLGAASGALGAGPGHRSDGAVAGGIVGSSIGAVGVPITVRNLSGAHAARNALKYIAQRFPPEVVAESSAAGRVRDLGQLYALGAVFTGGVTAGSIPALGYFAGKESVSPFARLKRKLHM